MLLYGKPISEMIENNITDGICELRRHAVQPAVCVIRMGENPDDIAYERMLKKKSEHLGIEFRSKVVSWDASQFELENAVRSANFDKEIHGILLMRPLAPQIDEEKICSIISHEKDIDGITVHSSAHIFTGISKGFCPCTAEACMLLLDHYNIELDGKDVTVVGRSLTIGKPISMMLLDRNATVTICHSWTKDLASKCSSADILITSIGKAEFFDDKYLHKGQIVIDVGINFDSNGKLVGDLDEYYAKKLELTYSPVPGGVGGITSSVLLWHTIQAAFNTIK